MGKESLEGLTLDAGALIAADRNDGRVRALCAEAVADGVIPIIPAPVLAQAWRSPRQARLAQLVNVCDVVPLDEALAKSVGVLCGLSKSADIVDAAVVAVTARAGGAVLTGDSKDIERIAAHMPGVKVVEL